MRKTFAVALALALAVVLVNDVSRLAAAHYNLDVVAGTTADMAVQAAHGHESDPTPGYEAALAYAEIERIQVVGYEQIDGRVHVWVDGPVEGTIILSPIVSLWQGGSWDTPMTIRKDCSRRIS